ncbi:methyltransferase domain-containing protein [Rehaibacterium terrae]|jgi:SAM-dependent methyltransferase|uniref:SAM-dependent methyltransferase n=1 Tax=Rehaibacterium terrae TaxID=1341696 RepID=A0A7W7XZE4_9GAMM|nr:methyltransferase domain-containing protein [Rehaibacterium terrae]MBB5015266.1 SAM-dependent methyltransferase [Rehaibacterium terrae]
MPAFVAARQSAYPAEAWFAREAVQRLLREEQRQVASDLGRAFGRYGLFLRPAPALAAAVPGSALRTVLSLYRAGDGLAGDLRCEDGALPLAGASCALVYAEHVIESSRAPAALVGEIARVLKPEGVALFVVFNPYGLARLRWLRSDLRATGVGSLAAWVREAGLEVQCCRYLGALWSGHDRLPPSDRPKETMIDRFRSSYLLQARRREVGLTPLRLQRTASVALKPGMYPG